VAARRGRQEQTVALTRGTCRRCGTDTISGLTGNGRAVALDVTVDATPLDPPGELRALMAGCATWTLHTVADELHPRPPSVIRSRPAGTRPRQTVHPTHWCTPTPGRTPPP
jgi:hypothetical protein